MTRKGAIPGTIAVLILATGFVACGDEDETTGGEETASAAEVTVTTGDTADGFSWEVAPTPTAETKTISYVNESQEGHAFILARISDDYTFEEAYDLQGKKGSATVVAESDQKTSPGPGETVTIDVTKPVEPGNYAMFCPIPGHYQQGQLEEFEVE